MTEGPPEPLSVFFEVMNNPGCPAHYLEVISFKLCTLSYGLFVYVETFFWRKAKVTVFISTA
jgi:hypothetical protein